MRWDAFLVLQQLLIVLTIASQAWIAVRIIRRADGAEQYVRVMAFATGLLVFLVLRPLGLTFADLMLSARVQSDTLHAVLIGGVLPFLVGVFVSEATILALRLGMPVPIRLALMVAAFTLSQAAYTNYVALVTPGLALDRAFIPNLCYAAAVGLWLTFRYRERDAAATPR